MNAKQKTLTYIAVAAIALTSLFAAWDLTGSPNHTNVTRYAPIFAPPDLSWWAKRELASSVFWTWLVIGGMYSLMFVALRDSSPQTRSQMDEQVSAAYAAFVDHPRYGRRPNITGLNPSPMDRDVQLHWNATTPLEIAARFEALVGKKWPYGDLSAYGRQTKRIPNTAVPADLRRQTPATIPVTHYFDLERQCRDCGRSFIFFAQEQKYWYEELGFGLESDCVRCIECRKKQQGIALQREIYESLFHVADKDESQTLEMASACLYLIEHDVFTTRQAQRVRMLLNSIPDDAEVRRQSRYTELVQRLLAVEATGGEQRDQSDPE